MNNEDVMAMDGEVLSDSNALAMLNKSEIDQQISTAKKYPRSIKRFRDECLSMVTLSEEVAAECIYALPRDGKTIEGPSARFAEVIASAWGNNRSGARVIAEEGDFVTAQGAFYDLERNVAISYEVKRRIVDKHGKRFKPDMIGVTANACCSVALRNAILKGVPKAFWSDMYRAARKAAVGDVKSIANRRASALEAFQKMGVTNEMIFRALGVQGVEDIGFDHLATLQGLFTALRDGDTTIEDAFPDASATSGIYVDTITQEEAVTFGKAWKDSGYNATDVRTFLDTLPSKPKTSLKIAKSDFPEAMTWAKTPKQADPPKPQISEDEKEARTGFSIIAWTEKEQGRFIEQYSTDGVADWAKIRAEVTILVNKRTAEM